MGTLYLQLQSGGYVGHVPLVAKARSWFSPLSLVNDGRCKRTMGTYLVTHKATWHLQEIRNTFYYITTVGEPSDSEWQDIADEIRADWVAELQPAIVNTYTLNGIDRRRVDLAGLLSFGQTFTAGPITGSSVSDSVPTQIALLISNKGVTTKPNRARTYLGGYREGDVIASLFAAAARSTGQDFVDLQSNLNTGGTNPLSRVAAQWNTSHTQVIATNDLSGAASVASIVPATQRRRRIGVGI